MSNEIAALSIDHTDIADGLVAHASDMNTKMNALETWAANEVVAKAVNLAGTNAQTISGPKTFTGTTIVPDKVAGNNTTEAANTKFVTAAVAAISVLAGTAITVDSTDTTFATKYGYSTVINPGTGYYYLATNMGGVVTFYSAARTGSSALFIAFSPNGTTWYTIRESSALGGTGIQFVVQAGQYFGFCTNMANSGETGTQLKQFIPFSGTEKPVRQ